MTDTLPGKQDEALAPGQPTTQRVQGIFSRIAVTYDLVGHLTSFGIDKHWRTVAVRLAALTPTSRVLDLAAGTGDLTIAMARQGKPATVLSTDFVSEMLEIGKRKAAAYKGPTKISFAQADAQDLHLDDESFDVVTISFGVRNLTDRMANFREVLRVLKPGGRYLVLEFSRPRSAFFRGVYHIYLRTIVPFFGWLIARDKESYEYLNDSIRAFPDQPTLAAELSKAGFSKVEWKDLTGGIVAVHVCTK